MKPPLYHSIQVGNILIPGNIIAAPMAGYTDATCRQLALEGGADLAWTEMISSEALIRGSGRTESMIARAGGESLLAVQLFGSDPEILGRAALRARELGADLLDLNAGCPVAKVSNKGSGASLSRDSVRLGEATAALCASGLPVSVKIRSGWDEDEINWPKAAETAVSNGACMLGFHPRTRRQRYGGTADRSLISELVNMVDVPVIGSGDLDTPEQARQMLKECECAGVMFARGAVGDPGIYRRTRELLKTGETPVLPSRRDQIAASLHHLKLAALADGEEIASREMKKHLAAYIRGWDSAAAFRNELMRASGYETLISLIESEIQEP